MYCSIIKVVPHEDFTLTIFFKNNESKNLDMKPYLNFGIFSSLKKYEKFKQVRISFDTLEWDGGLDLDPEFVWTHSKNINVAID